MTEEMCSVPEQIVASCSGALLTSFFATPLDVVKIRLQVQEKHVLHRKHFLYSNGLWDHIYTCMPKNKGDGKPYLWYHRPTKFKGTFDAFVKIASNEGLFSLWSGLSHTLIMAVPATALYFTTYDQLKSSYFNITESSSLLAPIISGTCARVITVTAISPLEFIRTKVQSERTNFSSILQSLLSMLRYNGITSLWKGLVPTLLRDVPFSAIYWSIYEDLKIRFAHEEYFLLPICASGATAGAVAATVTTPFDVIKTHRQIELGEFSLLKKKSRTYLLLQDLYKRKGVKGLFSGLAPRLIKISPSCALMITTYEFGKDFFIQRKLKEDKIL